MLQGVPWRRRRRAGGPINTAIWANEDDARLSRPPFRKAKATAAERGQSLKEFVTEALRGKLVLDRGRAPAQEPAWMQRFGKLKRLHKETLRVQSIIDQEFEFIEPEDRR